MPLSRLRRPLFWALVAYCLVLCLLRWQGFFELPVSKELEARTKAPVEAEAVLNAPVRRSGRTSRAFVELLRVGDAPCREKALLVLARNAAASSLRVGSLLRISGSLRLPRAVRKPGDFDEHGYLRDQGVGWVFHVRYLREVGERGSWGDYPLRWAQAVRESISRLLTRTYPPELASLLAGVLLGEKRGLDKDLSKAMKDAGVYHLIVPSGTNVAFVLLFALWLAGMAGVSRPMRFLPAVLLAVFYGLIAGTDPPYMRALLCSVFVIAAGLWERDCDLFQAWTVSALVLLVWEPRTLFQKGFQMSYAVVGSFVVATPDRLVPKAWSKTSRLVCGLMLTGIVAQLSLVPLLAEIGGCLSFPGILANVVLVPLSGIMLGAGFAFWAVSFLPWSPLVSAAALCTGFLAETFRLICVFFADLPGSGIKLKPMAPGMILGYYMVVLGIFLWRYPKIALCLAIPGFALVFVAAILII